MAKKSYLIVSSLSSDKIKGADLVAPASFDPERVQDYQAIVVRHGQGYREIIQRIRQHPACGVYCRPVFVKKESGNRVDDYEREVIDGIIDVVPIDQYLNTQEALVGEINHHINDMRRAPVRGSNDQYRLAVKVIRFLHSRSLRLKPIRYAGSVYGYSYPVIDILFRQSGYDEFHIVDFLEARNLIEGTFVDRVQSCNHCFSSYLNFREVCTSCGSADISSEDLVHHFSCGYVGPETDFLHEGEMVCPKCRKALKHIGVDFDRPSRIFACNRCENTFQEPNTNTLCFNCGRTSDTENLMERTIRDYGLTALGGASAISGIVYSLQEELGEGVEILSFDMFKIALNVEIERIKRYKRSVSSAVRITFSNYLDVMARLGTDSAQLSRQISVEINEFARTSDLVAYFNDTILLFLLTETDSKQARTAVTRFAERIQVLVKENLSLRLDIEAAIAGIDGKKSFDEILGRLITAKDRPADA